MISPDQVWSYKPGFVLNTTTALFYLLFLPFRLKTFQIFEEFPMDSSENSHHLLTKISGILRVFEEFKDFLWDVQDL